MNYECHDMVPDGIAPNIGYIAQAFEVKDLRISENVITELNCEIYKQRQLVDFPGLGHVEIIIVRSPGSGALQLIFQQINPEKSD